MDTLSKGAEAGFKPVSVKYKSCNNNLPQHVTAIKPSTIRQTWILKPGEQPGGGKEGAGTQLQVLVTSLTC